MFKNRKTATKTLVVLSFLAALSIVLSRFCVIYITNSIRISFGNIPIIMAGMFFGPIAGGLVGAVSDALGSAFLSGYGWYPPLTVSPILMGVIPGLLAPAAVKLKNKISPKGAPELLPSVCLVLPANIIASMGWTTYCLHILYGNPIWTLLSVRIPLYIAISAIETFVIFTLSKTGMFRTLGLGICGGTKNEL